MYFYNTQTHIFTTLKIEQQYLNTATIRLIFTMMSQDQFLILLLYILETVHWPNSTRCTVQLLHNPIIQNS